MARFVSKEEASGSRAFPSADFLCNDLLHCSKALFKIQLRGVQQHGIIRLLERRSGAMGVLIVPLLHVGQNFLIRGVDALFLILFPAAGSAGLRAGGERKRT